MALTPAVFTFQTPSATVNIVLKPAADGDPGNPDVVLTLFPALDPAKYTVTQVAGGDGTAANPLKLHVAWISGGPDETWTGNVVATYPDTSNMQIGWNFAVDNDESSGIDATASTVTQP